MNNLSAHIGALELSHAAAGFGDAAIELQAAGPTQRTFPYRCMNDGTLELAAREAVAQPRTQRWPGGPCG